MRGDDREETVDPSWVVGVVCAACATESGADRVPDACFTCGTVDPPWVVLTMRTRGATMAIGMELHGSWSDADAAEAERLYGHVRRPR